MEQSSTGQAAQRAGLQIGFALSHEQFPAPRLLDYGVAAERAGFDMVWTSDHFQPWQANQGHAGHAWVTLSALGQRTTRAPMGTGVTCPTYRYRPAIVAEAFATLSLFYPGRIFLGVGSGEKLNEAGAGGGWGHYDERAGRLAEAVEIIRQLWSGQPVSYRGRYYEVEGKLYDPPPRPIPVYIAASGPQSARLAGEHGDGLIADPGALGQNPEYKAAWEEGARGAGKDPATLPILAEHYVVVGDEAEARRGAELWRFLPNAWHSGYFDNISPQSIQEHAEGEVPIEKVLSRWVISADAETHVQALQELVDNGVTHVFIHSPQEDQNRVISFFGERVLPCVREGVISGVRTVPRIATSAL